MADIYTYFQVPAKSLLKRAKKPLLMRLSVLLLLFFHTLSSELWSAQLTAASKGNYNRRFILRGENRNMKIAKNFRILFFSLILFSSLFKFSAVHAVDCGANLQPDPKTGICLPASVSSAPQSLNDTIYKVVNYALGLAGLIAVVFLIYGGYLYIFSGASEELAKKGRATITNALIGIVIIILAYVIVNVVVGTVSGVIKS